MKVALSGVGYRSVQVLTSLKQAMPGLEVVGYFDPAPAYLNRLDTEPPGFESVATMVRETKPDLLVVGSPNDAHLDQIRVGLDAGVRVFSEKPLVASMDQTWAMADLLRQHGPDRVLVGLVLRYAPQTTDLRAAIAKGRLGRIVSIEANEHVSPGHGAFFMRDWRRYSARSGGVMLEKACHDIDLYNWIVGARPVSVASFGGRASFVPENEPDDLGSILSFTKQPTGAPPSNPFTTQGDIIDHQTALIAFENGVSMAFHLSLNAPDEQRRYGIFGTHGMAVGDFHGGYLQITGRDETPPGQSFAYEGGDPESGHYGADMRMAEAVAAHLRGEGADLPVSSIDALVAGAVCLALDEARLSGRMVDLSETWARLDGYFSGPDSGGRPHP